MELILEERGKGIVKDYFLRYLNTGKNYKESPVVYETLLDMVLNDPVMFTALSLTVDLVTQNGYDFYGKNTRLIEEARTLFADKLDFDQVIKNIVWQLLIFGDSYLEVGWNESKTKVIELNALESSQMRPNYTESGEIIGYVQKLQGKGEQEFPKWSVDEVIYFRQYKIGSRVFSYPPFQSVAKSYATKVYVNDYLQSVFRNLPPKMIYSFQKASEKQQELLIENVLRAKTNPNLDIFAQGENFKAEATKLPLTPELMEVKKELQKEVLMITRVPPHWLGMLDGANRGIGENVVIPFETKIKAIQHDVASQVNKELLPKLGLSNLKFKWNPISLADEKNIIANAGQLKAIGLDPDSLIEYLREHGINLRPGAKIEEPEIQAGSPQIQKDSSPSRQRMGKGDTMNNQLDKKGVSEAGKEKMEARK